MAKAEKAATDRSKTIKLLYPVEWGKETVSEITLNPPKGGDIEHLGEKPTMKDLMVTAAKCAKVPYSVVREMDAADAQSVCEAVTDFLQGSQGTGDHS